jgi:hypothetical protein
MMTTIPLSERRWESICHGLTGDQLCDICISENEPRLYVRRTQLTWRVIGFAEAFGLRVEQLVAIVDDAGLFIVWRGEADDSIRAWREAEQRLKLRRPARHFCDRT